MRDEPPWSGVWVQRLGLRAAAAACRRLGRTEAERALRDLWQMRSEESGVGPSGAVLRTYQQLTRTDALDADVLARVAGDFGYGQNIEATSLGQALKEIAEGAPPLQAAAKAAAAIMEAAGATVPAELFALWAADAVIAKTLGWQKGLPLLSGEMLTASSPRPFRPGNPEWLPAAGACVAAGRGPRRRSCRRNGAAR